MATGRQYELRGLIRRVSHGHRSGIRKVFLAQPGNEARRRCAGLQIVLLVLVRLRRFDCGRGALDNQTEDPSALAALNRPAPTPGDAPRGGYSDRVYCEHIHRGWLRAGAEVLVGNCWQW